MVDAGLMSWASRQPPAACRWAVHAARVVASPPPRLHELPFDPDSSHSRYVSQYGEVVWFTSKIILILLNLAPRQGESYIKFCIAQTVPVSCTCSPTTRSTAPPTMSATAAICRSSTTSSSFIITTKSPAITGIGVRIRKMI